jgi:hypothetical protein
MKQLLGIPIIFSAAALICISAGADPIFRNSTNDLVTRFEPGTLEVGDEVILAGPARYLTNFSFEFWGTNTANAASFAGSVEAKVRFYQNDGALFNGYPTPSNMIYDSGWFNVSLPTARQTFTFSVGNGDFPFTGLLLPSDTNLTWSVQFTGMGVTDHIGVDLYSPPTVGTDYPDYWENNGTSWSLKTNSIASQMNFGATFDASIEPVPEPSIALLSVFGGALGLAGANRARSRK